MIDIIRLRKQIRRLYPDKRKLTLEEYTYALKLAGFSSEESVDFVKQRAIKENVSAISIQLSTVRQTYLLIPDDVHETGRRRMIGRHTQKEWEAKLEQYNYRCVYCGKKLDKPSKDHLIPISRGGTNYIGNIVPSCWDCNHKKLAQMPEKFAPVLALKLV